MTSERSRPSGQGGRRRPAAVSALWLAAALAVAAPAAGQQSLASNRFNFDFSNPGARSLGFGGAFAGLADDATAAFANPAGLVQLARPEVSLEGRWWERSPRFLAGGVPVGPDPDADPGLFVGRAESDAAGPSFAAVVLPRGAWSFAVYGHQLSLFEIEAGFEGLSPGPPGEPPPFFSPDLDERVDLDVVTAGFAAARRLGERFSVGVAVVRSDISLTSSSSATLELFDPGPIFPGFPFPTLELVSRRELTIDDDDWTVQGGVLLRAAEGLSAGLFVRQGAEGEGRLREEVELFGQQGSVSEGTGTFSVPDVWGGGVAYRTPGGRWTLAAEVDRVLYGSLLREVIDGQEVGALEYPDAWQYRFGFELALLQRRPVVAFRLGGWQSEGDDLFGETVSHLAVGLGIAAQRVQIDLAADFSDEVDTGSASFIFAF